MKKMKKVHRTSKPKSKIIRANLRKKFICKKSSINSKFLKTQELVLSPLNTSQYLISNNSTPFYPEEEDDLDFNFDPTPLELAIGPYPQYAKIDAENSEMKNTSLELELASTAAQWQDFSEIKKPEE